MKNFLKENWFKIMAVSAVLFIVIGFFYWYEWRPSSIRKECMADAQRGITGIDEKEFKVQEFLAKQGEQKYIDEIYLNCLKKNGLEK